MLWRRQTPSGEITDRIIITPGKRRGSYSITLQRERVTILDWIERAGKPGCRPIPGTTSFRLFRSVKTRPMLEEGTPIKQRPVFRAGAGNRDGKEAAGFLLPIDSLGRHRDILYIM